MPSQSWWEPLINVLPSDAKIFFFFHLRWLSFHSKSANSFSRNCSAIPCVVPWTLLLKLEMTWSREDRWSVSTSNFCASTSFPAISRARLTELRSQCTTQSLDTVSSRNVFSSALFSLCTILNLTVSVASKTSSSPFYVLPDVMLDHYRSYIDFAFCSPSVFSVLFSAIGKYIPARLHRNL